MKIVTAFRFLKKGRFLSLVKQFFLSNQKPKDGPERFVNSCRNTFSYLKRKFKDCKDEIFEISNNDTDYVWFVWLQGEEKMPALQKKCFASLKKFITDKKIVLISDKNKTDFINIPSFIEEKYKKGLIPKAHYCDIVRSLLLIKYGGTYFDSTILVTSYPRFIFNDSFFVFKEIHTNNSSFLCSNFLIHTKKDNPILKKTLSYLFEYWRRYDYVCHYYIFYFFMHLAVDENISLWISYSNFPNSTPQLLLDNLNNTFDALLMENILNASSVHKTYYIKNVINDSFYDKIFLQNILNFPD